MIKTMSFCIQGYTFLLLGLLGLNKSLAFSPTAPLAFTLSRSPTTKTSRATTTCLSAEAETTQDQEEAEDPLEGLDQQRKDQLFQCLLRDLQIEGTPLLECDAFQAHTLQAALWTTMAELSEQEESQKVCLVLQEIGVDALRTFVDDFLILKTQTRLMDHLPELQRFNIAIVGKGAVPAIVIETKDVKDSQSTTTTTNATTTKNYEEFKVNAAQKVFVDRMIVGQEVCPYTKSTSQAPQGLEDVNIQPSPIGYRYCGFSEVCHVLSAFWNCVCELLSVPDDQLSSVILSLPAIGDNNNSEDKNGVEANHARFSAVAELLSRSLCLFRGDDVFETLHFFPGYNRNLVHPPDQPAHGHLPPLAWMNPILRKSGQNQHLSQEEIALSDYQRRAPFTSVVIKRVSYFEALAGSANEIVDLPLDDGSVEKASGVPCYANNAIRLAAQGEEALEEAIQAEIAMGQ